MQISEQRRQSKAGTLTRHNEGIRKADAGSTDAEGFIAPSVGIVEHALYFTTAPDVLAKTILLLDDERLDTPGAVIVWDETIGRRTGARAVPGSWWATAGSLTVSLVFPLSQLRAFAGTPAQSLDLVGSAVTQSVAAFGPAGELIREGGSLALGGKHLGRLQYVEHGEFAVFVVRIHANTDFTRAPESVRLSSCRLADDIDVSALPLGTADTLANALSQELMTRVPGVLGYS